MDDAHVRKRPRPVVSCLRCREKKLKCDRTTPCENCVKAHMGNACAYSKNAHVPQKESSPNHTAVSTTPSISALEELQMRMARVEELLGVDQPISIATDERVAPHVLGTVVVKGTRTVYHGQNDRTTLLNQFLDVKDYINDAMTKDEQLVASIKQVKFLQNKSREKITSPESVNEQGFSLALLKLREFLPSRAYCTRLVKIYSQYYERTMRVLHIPSFTRQCDNIWTEKDPEICNTSSILPLLTAVITISYHMDDRRPSNEEQNYRNYLKGAAIDMIQAWLDELPRKQRTELATLQVETLLLLSRSLRHSRPQAPEQLWSSTGALVRSAVAMGLNVNPANLPDMAPFQVEMRRRLWATILEIDLQASMTCGMPLIVPDLDPMAAMPLNLNDSDFDETTSPLPPSRPLSTYTDNVHQVILASSLADRLKATSLVQRLAPNLQAAVNLGRKVQDAISRIPSVLSLPSDTNTTSPLDPGSLLHRVLLDLYLRRPLLCLYKPLLTTISAQTTPLYEEIQQYCLTSSDVILQYQDLYTISALASITESPWANQNFFYRCCKTDIMWIALGLCQHIKQLSLTDGVDNDIPATSNGYTSDTIKHTKPALVNRVQRTITHLVSRIGQKGSDLKDIVFLALALASCQLPSSTTPQQRAQVLQGTLRTTLSDCREKLLQPFLHDSSVDQQDSTPGPPAKRARTHGRGSVPVIQAAYSSNVLSRPPMTDPRLTPSTLSEFATYPMDISVNGTMEQQWLGEVPELAAEFSTLQGDLFSGNVSDALNFGIAQDWNWEHMWQ